jgi:hypothetical protein
MIIFCGKARRKRDIQSCKKKLGKDRDLRWLLSSRIPLNPFKKQGQQKNL